MSARWVKYFCPLTAGSAANADDLELEEDLFAIKAPWETEEDFFAIKAPWAIDEEVIERSSETSPAERPGGPGRYTRC